MEDGPDRKFSMITKATKLTNFGIFHDFAWKPGIPEFKKYNLIYGWNRSGKTTISRCFSACERRSVGFKQYPSAAQFQITLDDNSHIKSEDVEKCILPVKVFNKDFIEDNISFDPSNPCNAIVYVSEEDIESAKKLLELKGKTALLAADLKRTQATKKAKEDAKNTFLRNLGVEISKVLFDKTYNKTHVESRINKIGVDNFAEKIVSDEKEAELAEIRGSKPKDTQASFKEFGQSFVFGNETDFSLAEVYAGLKKLLEKKVISEVLERLKNDKDLNTWVKQGFDLHKAKKETDVCLFCQKPLDADFMDSLSKHFNEDYENMQNDIDHFITELGNWKRDSIAAENSDLYPDLRKVYKEQSASLNKIVLELNQWIDKAVKKLHEKFGDPLSAVELPEEPSDFKASYNGVIGEINNIVGIHNKKVEDHAMEVKSAREALELHLIGEAIRDQNYKKMQQEVADAEKENLIAFALMTDNTTEIRELEAKTSNIGPALTKINKHLAEFFGRKEIQLELDPSKKGYVIKRDGLPADNLSEGEKTAIAFSYFMVKVQEKGFIAKDGIIFVDDPISSLDSNFIYHCFSLIRSHFDNVGQLFISTHNFELFNLIKKWLNQKNQRRIRDKKEEVCSFYMIENFIEDEKRNACFVALEPTLLKYNSEYQFLFDQLNKFAQNTSPVYKDLYTIANIARRFLEIFTNFKIPTSGDLLTRIDALGIDTEQISKTEQGRVYKLIQEFSHGSDATSTIEHKDRIESQDAVKILLRMVQESDPKHFELLMKSVTA